MATTYPKDTFLDIARGLVPNTKLIHGSGFVKEVAISDCPVTVWEGKTIYPWTEFDTEPRTLYVQSTDVLDTGSVVISGLDSNYDEYEENVDIDGTTVVTTVGTFYRVNSLIYLNGLENNAGTITARVASAAGTIVGQIEPSNGQSLMGLYTIPAGYTGYAYYFDYSINKGHDAEMRLMVRRFGRSFLVGQIAEIFEESYEYRFRIPYTLPEKTDICNIVNLVENSNTKVSTNFDIIIIKNGLTA